MTGQGDGLKAPILACPIDGLPLAQKQQQLVCEQGHAFDIARQGYVNLLPVQHKRSKHPGDSKEMVIARRQFLNTGVYAPLAQKLANMVAARLVENRQGCVMDAGCGEGYYLDYVYHHMSQKEPQVAHCFIGLDISKPAIVEAAKRNRQISWVVGSNRQPPVPDASVDIILCVFGFHSFDGFSKVLKPGGHVILVEPNAEHLTELREIIYSDVKKTGPAELKSAQESGFSLLDSQSLQFNTGLIDSEQISNLLLMTPHFFRASQQGREAALHMQQLELSVDVVFRVLQKR
jgi:23S rRNA (guanine745-N1)-methyltransferase